MSKVIMPCKSLLIASTTGFLFFRSDNRHLLSTYQGLIIIRGVGDIKIKPKKTLSSKN